MMRYVWSGYWGTWSRVLAEVRGATIELNMTPVNGIRGDWKREVAPIVLRKHGIERHRADVFAPQIPRSWWDLIGQNVGKELRHRLATEDFLPQIDWSLYERVAGSKGGGGVPLSQCLMLPRANQGRAA